MSHHVVWWSHETPTARVRKPFEPQPPMQRLNQRPDIDHRSARGRCDNESISRVGGDKTHGTKHDQQKIIVDTPLLDTILCMRQQTGTILSRFYIEVEY